MSSGARIMGATIFCSASYLPSTLCDGLPASLSVTYSLGALPSPARASFPAETNSWICWADTSDSLCPVYSSSMSTWSCS